MHLFTYIQRTYLLILLVIPKNTPQSLDISAFQKMNSGRKPDTLWAKT